MALSAEMLELGRRFNIEAPKPVILPVSVPLAPQEAKPARLESKPVAAVVVKSEPVTATKKPKTQRGKRASKPTSSQQRPPVSLIAGSFEATQEQIEINAAVENLVENGGIGALKLIAYAGTGKTTTLNYISKNALSKYRGIYLSFNKDIVADAGSKMSSNVACSTIHSLAMRTTGLKPGEFKNLNTQVVRAMVCNDTLIPPKVAEAPYITQQYWISEALRHFCTSADQSIGQNQIDYVLEEVVGTILGAKNDVAKKKILARRAAAQKVLEKNIVKCWEEMAYNKRLWSFDAIIKMFELDDSTVEAAFSGRQFLLLDEAQDLNGVMRSIARKTCENKRMLIAVGDPWQQIYSWNGAENALDYIDGNEKYLTQSFRFGNEVAKLATSLLFSKPEEAPTRPLRGNPNKTTRIELWTYRDQDKFFEKGDTVICRTNAGILEAALQAAYSGMTIYIVKGIDDLIAEYESGIALYENKIYEVRHQTFKPFQSWQECLAYVEATENSGIKKMLDDIIRGAIKKKLETIRNALVSSDKEADVRFSTAHKAKGREFDNVIVYKDFGTTERLKARYHKACEAVSDRARQVKAALEEWHVKYVAMTRAIKVLIDMTI